MIKSCNYLESVFVVFKDDNIRRNVKGFCIPCMHIFRILVFWIEWHICLYSFILTQQWLSPGPLFLMNTRILKWNVSYSSSSIYLKAVWSDLLYCLAWFQLLILLYICVIVSSRPWSTCINLFLHRSIAWLHRCKICK